MKQLLSRFLSDESGAAAVEYVLIGVLIALAIIVGASAVGTNLNTRFDNAATTVSSW
jgi:pilus assembly protein Flp/PilA